MWKSFAELRGRPIYCTWRCRQMETFSALLAICAGIHRSPGNFPHKGQWRGALMFSLICVWENDWVNNREAGDLRRYRAHNDAIVMNKIIVNSVHTSIWYDDLYWMFRPNKQTVINNDGKVKSRSSIPFSWHIYVHELKSCEEGTNSCLLFWDSLWEHSLYGLPTTECR